jgi:hypothetical protein
MAMITGVALLGILFLELHFRADSPETRWYDGGRWPSRRRVWAGGMTSAACLPTRRGRSRGDPAVHRPARDPLLNDGATSDAQPPRVSDAMWELRVSDLATCLRRRSRREPAGVVGGRSETNDHHAHSARRILYVVTAAGIVVAFARAFGFVTFDLAGVASALIAAAVAWSGAKQYATLARACTYAAMELRIAEDRLMVETDEATWAAKVADAEEAVSREHTICRASRPRATS